MRKKAILVLVVALLVIAIIGIFFVIRNQQSIYISNQSKSYEVTYKENKMFLDLLDKWSMWMEKKISIDNAISAYTAKRINIVITDQPQTAFKVIGKSSPPVTFAGSSVKMNKDTLTVYAYLNSNRLATEQPHEFGYLKDIDGFFLWIVLDAIYTSTHMTGSHADLSENTFQINTAINDLRNANSDPFTIRSRQ